MEDCDIIDWMNGIIDEVEAIGASGDTPVRDAQFERVDSAATHLVVGHKANSPHNLRPSCKAAIAATSQPSDLSGGSV